MRKKSGLIHKLIQNNFLKYNTYYILLLSDVD